MDVFGWITQKNQNKQMVKSCNFFSFHVSPRLCCHRRCVCIYLTTNSYLTKLLSPVADALNSHPFFHRLLPQFVLSEHRLAKKKEKIGNWQKIHHRSKIQDRKTKNDWLCNTIDKAP